MNGEAPAYQKWWQQQLQLQAAAKQQAWKQQQQLTPGAGGALYPWAATPPGVNAPVANPLLGRFPVASLAEADPGNALAGFFMGNQDISSNPLLMHALLGGEPGFANI